MAAILLLVAVALTAIGTAGVVVLRGQLLDRTDAQLGLVALGYPDTPVSAGSAGSDTEGKPQVAGVGLYRVQRHDADGSLVRNPHEPEPEAGREAAALDVPEDAAWLKKHEGHPMTVSSTTSDGDWRILVQPLPDTSGWIVAAAALGDHQAVVSELVTVDVTVGALCLLTVAVVGTALVRTALRPLVRVEKTAAAIAAGDLTQRVPEHPQRTELGRLGRALNGMLGQIEGAFRARAESESTARRSEERMRRFVADAGHDLRTPLAVIRAWADYCHRGPRRDRAELEQILATVGTEATRMGTLIEDLLLLARLDQQRPLRRSPVDLLALAADAARDACLLAPDRDIRLTADGSTAYVVSGDADRLRQVLTNLTGNALTHTPPGTPVALRLRPGRLDTTAAVVLDVADEGPGLTAEQAERVFERFYRTDTSRTRSTGGSGLGLAIVASLTAAHGGTVIVDTEHGAGATFRVTLPLAGPAASSEQE
ncbi:HAMP domain-containing sensor histidine kinase [Streptomyces sp. B8F3]|uniref:sensor histidine kinase n=1 Tax=Streptomyces sp. B8F3 TaxID=3153573 RepID=UPI00325F4C0B